MTDSPFLYERPVSDTRLLELRKVEIDYALDAVAPETGAGSHALIVGDHGTGRTSTLNEVARRAAEERGFLVVSLRPTPGQTASREGLVGHFLIVAVEAIVSTLKARHAGWYSAWRDRVYLRRTSPSNETDLLNSALLLGADPLSSIDPRLLERDLVVLRELAAAEGIPGFVVTFDDATEWVEDVDAVEQLTGALSAARGWRLLLATLPVALDYLREALSPCLRATRLVPLIPFGLHQTMACIKACLDDVGGKYGFDQDVGLTRDLQRLTGGNPFEVMLVAHNMWLARELGEAEKLALTPSVLNRIVAELALHTTGGEALFDGAMAIRNLQARDIQLALEMVAFSQLTIRQIAIARTLGVSTRDDERVQHDATADAVDEAQQQVQDELMRLQEVGLVQLAADGARFSVHGGRAASVLLKYEARSRYGPDVSGRPFDMSFLIAVGRAIVRDVFSHTRDAVGGARNLAFSVFQPAYAFFGPRRSPRQAVSQLSAGEDLSALADIGFIPWSKEGLDHLADLVVADDVPPLALVAGSVGDLKGRLEYAELWELPGDFVASELPYRLAAAVDEVAGAVEVAELRWHGAECAVVSGESARAAVIVCQPLAADFAIAALFEKFFDTRDPAGLLRAKGLAEIAVTALRGSYSSPRGQAVYLSPALSRLGFLQSLEHTELEAARAHLEEALELGPGDGWVTEWNLSNVAARQGEYSVSRGRLTRVQELISAESWGSYAVFYFPRVDPTESLVFIPADAVGIAIRLQLAMLAYAETGGLPDDIGDALAAADAVEDARFAQVAGLVRRYVDTTSGMRTGS